MLYITELRKSKVYKVKNFPHLMAKKKSIAKSSPKNSENTFGIISLVLGIASIFLFWFPLLSLPAAIVGIVLGLKQQRIAKNSIATAGLIISIVSSVISFLYLIYWIFLIIMIGAAFSSMTGALFWPFN